VNNVIEDFTAQLAIYSYFLTTGLTRQRMDIFAEEGQDRIKNYYLFSR